MLAAQPPPALVVIVFLGFAVAQTMGVKEFDLALPIAVDTTLVRCTLVAPTMSLTGRTGGHRSRCAAGTPGWACMKPSPPGRLASTSPAEAQVIAAVPR